MSSILENLEHLVENTTGKRRSSSSGSLPPPLQKLIDKAEKDEELYEDPWGKAPALTDVDKAETKRKETTTTTTATKKPVPKPKKESEEKKT
ncbi:hypothetical protein HRR83_000271 [Exophiala dermatitidis]|uniref:Uncharacterized protein n=2 Tax=Exophiala dermatitidis TaxID=5970 RepID=H6C8T6_EXODN|nr:uncharacterized protein HMPREF1120_08469 [Exophiala dermatitidis NIH/UT8656]KAJ4523624.1 hypothetical protein HRR73_002807 [Exophiala dermatitidis]EHY60513.1 hypothetical protein HMPREF1120_08469 [Exophiala dermatitidis NIH/UT8656]KAJ4524651.1 hypothetical protein HRR75_000241 [Exophiala dermatitidis]KAJ4527519.1 hypothetical protein HRR74_000273 [Exophiala dermatitidis]KAJ4531092.1 hypothetical protein HRR76_008769 [Exophiala dermatitidis]